MLDCTQFKNDTQLTAMCNMVNENQTNDAVDLNGFFVIWAAVLVFFMHVGFAMLSAGAVRAKNATNILMCILLDACMCAIAWWAAGYGFAYGEDKGRFIGSSYFAGMGMGGEYTYAKWFFQYAFAATAATIVSGAVAERQKFESYLSISLILSIWVYPVAVHWVWGGGFLTIGGDGLFGCGVVDHGGDGPVHLLGGLAGAIGSKVIGPRLGRFDANGKPVPIRGHSTPLATLGTFILWVGWFGFNGGSFGEILGNGVVMERAVVNTLLASATGAITSLLVSSLLKRGRDWDISVALNGTLAGLVGITSGCSVVETWGALVIGAISGAVYVACSIATIQVFHIDDPLDASAVHFGCGAMGLILTGFFADPAYVQRLSSDFTSENKPTYAGVFYGGDGSLLAAQVVEILVISGWVTVFMLPYFMLLKKTGKLRISPKYEQDGMDASVHQGEAYPNEEVRNSLFLIQAPNAPIVKQVGDQELPCSV
uniref:Ammonium transporter n=1 Tax=Mucochytrium quahogii TaxID=96639 RepID=A0A7S2S6X0_9STRA|mmetsp:Transcript_15341/g.25007  ORF Transcript_15341/g.25007 Transcript_15341/m.25007 type:complete len:483 (-) Transcript_15341:62-1510(-)